MTFPRRTRTLAALTLTALTGVGLWGALTESARPAGALGGAALNAPGGREALGPFTLRWGDGELSVTRGAWPVWDSGRRAFVTARAVDARITERRGMVRLRERPTLRCARQTVTRVGRAGPDALEVTGDLRCGGNRTVPYTLTLRADAGILDARLTVRGAVNRVALGGALRRQTRVTGGGEQFSTLDLRGRHLPVLVSEQGVGRGEQPITLLADLTNGGAGGRWYSSYAPMPHLILMDPGGVTRNIWSLDTTPGVLDLRGQRWSLEITGTTLHARLSGGPRPQAATEAFTRDSGRMDPPPRWTQRGVIVGVQGGTARVREVYARLRAAGVPVAGLWLQDWVGRRQTSFGQQLWWNWELDRDHYPGWDALRRDLARDGVRLLGYVNPFLTDVSAKGNARRNLYAEAARRGYLLKTAGGRPYDQRNTSFGAALVDLSNPAAYAWLRGHLSATLRAAGLSGWMADFGESFPLDGAPARGAALDLHNAYPTLWAQLNRDVMSDLGGEGELLVFHRSAYTRTPGAAGAFWAGDQLVNWGPDDGLASALTGLLSGGLSGMTVNHADAGGYTTITQRPMNIRRSPELLDRWLELSAFTPLLRTHEGNRPADNAQAYDPDRLPALARAARWYAALAPYRAELFTEAAGRGTPLLRPVWYEFPDEPFEARPQAFLLGPAVLVAPALRAGQHETTVTLPAGPDWTHAWTGDTRPGGTRVTVPSPPGQPAVFIRADRQDLIRALRR